VKNLSDGRIAKYIFALIVFRRHLTCNFREAARPEIEKVVLWLNSHDYTQDQSGHEGSAQDILPLGQTWEH
jgi:hypothetical protein